MKKQNICDKIHLVGDTKRMLVYICEDNGYDMTMLQKNIETVAGNMQIPIDIHSFSCAEKLLLKLEKEMVHNGEVPDILFSDIKMSGMNGIDLGKKLVQIAPRTVFVFLTAYEEYAIQGYETRAYRYLLKPVTGEEIAKILMDVYKMYFQNKVIKIYHGNKEILIPINEIRYICAEDKYSVVHTINGNFLDRKSLNYFEESVNGTTFFRVHRKYLVNMRFHKEMRNGNIILDNDEVIPVSRRKKTDYHAYLCRLLEGDLLR